MSMPRASHTAMLVVGGGPAGATAALVLARHGHEVLVLEKRLDFRAKVCGEFVSAEGVAVLHRLGVLPDLFAAGAVPIRRTRIHGFSGAAFATSLPDSDAQCGLGVSRAVLDEALLERARAAGARVLRGARLTGISPSPTGWTVRFSVEGGARAVRAAVVLGADGRNSSVARWAGIEERISAHAIGVQVHLPRVDRGEDRVELFFLRAGYAGLAPVESSRFCLGALLQAPIAPEDPFLRLADALPPHPLWGDPRELPRRFLDRAAAWPVSTGIRRSAPAGMFLAGDAAGFVDPFSGQGIALALLAGEACARAMGGEIAGDGRAARREYERFLRRELVSRLAVMATLRRLLSLPGGPDRVIDLCRRHPALGKRVVDLTRVTGSPLLSSLPRLAGRLWTP
jgi:flavin-dependent dehydrogenase